MRKNRRLQPEEVFAKRFVIGAFIGQGSMGAVYRATDRQTGEPRALKVMSADLADDPGFVHRFMLEARVGARVESPHVVRVLLSGVDEATGLPYLAMELLVGMDLERRLASGRELERAEAAAVLRALFHAMSAAHRANIVHRDLKPENLFLADTPAGATLKVLDFGVAKVFKESTTVGGTKPGLGTPLWTAPEQGLSGQKIRPPSDVWALGLITYRLLAGKPYWVAASTPKASQFDLALEILKAPIAPASERSVRLGARDLGPAFDAWFARCVNRDAARRYPNAGAAWEELEPILAGRPSLLPRSTTDAPRGAARRGAGARLVPIGALLVLVLAGVAIGLLLGLGR
ncbi:MAG: serine/threonine-protein kinase [Polyangiaceae bacterium]